MKACLIGKTLKHSFSKSIHESLGLEYDLVELSEDELAEFVAQRKYDNFNVTIPYKEKIMPLLDELDDSAYAVGSVNTVKNVNGRLIGYNTDIYGMKYLFEKSGVCLKDKNVVILGTGGTSKTAQALMNREGVKSVTVVGRRERWNYQNIGELKDTQILINTTPVGMYPDSGTSPVDVGIFKELEFVADVIYNPLRTQLIIDAEKMGIACSNGLSMLVYQAVRAEEIWLETSLNNRTEKLLASINDKVFNIVLEGMPSSGKSSVGRALAKKLGKEFVDFDEVIENRLNKTIPQVFDEYGEEYFRDIESEVAKEYGKKNGLVIATGGGTPIREKNRDALTQNGFVVWLKRNISLLTSKSRPLSQKIGVEKLYDERKEIYKAFADVEIENVGDIDTVAEDIRRAYEESIGH